MLGFSDEQMQALDRLFKNEPLSSAKVRDWHTQALIMLYRKFFGENTSEGEYVFLCQVRDKKVTLDESYFWSSWSPTYWKLRNRFGATRDRRAEMSSRAEAIGGGNDESIYRDCCADEATDAQSTNTLTQHRDSFDKYKWLFVDLAHAPIQSKDPDFRLTITVRSGTKKLLDDLSVQHVGKVESCVVSRCYQRLRAKGITVNEGVPNEVGSYAIHEDVLDILCQKAVKSITKAKK